MIWQIATVVLCVAVGVLVFVVIRKKSTPKALGDSAVALAEKNKQHTVRDAAEAIRESEDRMASEQETDRSKAEEEINRADDPTRDIHGRKR